MRILARRATASSKSRKKEHVARGKSKTKFKSRALSADWLHARSVLHLQQHETFARTRIAHACVHIPH